MRLRAVMRTGMLEDLSKGKKAGLADQRQCFWFAQRTVCCQGFRQRARWEASVQWDALHRICKNKDLKNLCAYDLR